MSISKVGWLSMVLTSGLLLVVGCGGSTGPPAATSPGPSSVSASATTSAGHSPPASASPSASPAVTGTGLADGRYPARIVAVDPARRLVTVDVVQFFMGKAAASAAAQDHAPEVPPPNDYWIRNTNPALRTLYVASTAPISVNVLGASITHDAVKNLPVSLSRLARFSGLSGSLFWLTVEHQVVTRVAEQYLP